jgi:hypothetical protein
VTTSRIFLALLVLVAVGLYLGPYRNRKSDEAELARIAGVIAGREVEVSCPGTLAKITEIGAEDGSVAFTADGHPTDEAKLSSGTCARLRGLLHGKAGELDCLRVAPHCPSSVEEAAIAVNALSHEAWHLAGVREEAIAQCYALQTNAATAVRLGATPEDAEAVATFVLRDVQPALPSDYRSADCHDGGPLDLHPDRGNWP